MTVKQTHIVQKIAKTSVLFVGTLFATLILLRLLLMTGIAHNVVKSKIERIAQKSLNAEFKIGKVKGDLWKQIVLTEVQINRQGPFLSVDSVIVEYSILSFISGENRIEKIFASGIDAFISETADSSFDVLKIIRDEPSSIGTQNTKPATFSIEDIEISNAGFELFSPSYLPDSTAKISNLNSRASIKDDEKLEFTLSKFEFNLTEGRLPEPISFGSSATIIADQITLNELVIETGKSLITTQASSNLSDSTLFAEMHTLPFSLADIEPYLDMELPEEEFNMSLTATGSLDSLTLKLELNHPLFPNFFVSSGFNLRPEPSLTHFGIVGEGLDIASFTNDSIPLSFGDFRISFSGKTFQELKRSDLAWEITFTEVVYDEHYFERIIGAGTLRNEISLSNIEFYSKDRNYLRLTPSIYDVFSPSPSWDVKLDARSINFALWTGNNKLSSNVNFRGEIKGKGFSLNDDKWTFTISNFVNPFTRPLDISQLMGQSFLGFNTEGFINQNELSLNGLVKFFESEVNFGALINDFRSEKPTFTYSLFTENFNAAEINQLAEFPTSINLIILGEGEGLNPDGYQMSASVSIDTSIVNGSKFDRLNAFINFKDGVLNISEGVLNSEIISGIFSGRKNVTDNKDLENWLFLDMNILDTQPLAPLVHVNELQLQGIVRGRITQDTTGVLRGNMLVDLKDILVDSTFIADGIEGVLTIEMQEIQGFSGKLEIISPVIKGIRFQDIELEANGKATSDSLSSLFNLTVAGSDRGELIQHGALNVQFQKKVTEISFDTFDFITRESELLLQRPFTISINKGAISTDTLDLKSQSDAYLSLAIPYADSVEQFGWLNGENFDVGLMQEVIFGRKFLDGILSGQAFFNKSLEDVTGDGAINVSKLNYSGVDADDLIFNFNIANERLSVDGSISWENEKKVFWDIDVPFVFNKPNEIKDEFFDRYVEGSLFVKPSILTRFKPLLKQLGVTDTDGLFTFNVTMRGTAGSPNFEGDVRLTTPIISGIPVDSVLGDFRFNEERKVLEIQSKVVVAAQEAASIELSYPINYDFRTFELLLPTAKDSIKALATTKDFNLAVLNDFLDNEHTTKLKGTLNADLTLIGTKENMVPSGFLRVGKGAVTLPKAGITLENLISEVEFAKDGLQIKNISAKSGKGSFATNGTVMLSGITPESINLTMRAEQFKLANTNDFNLTIDLDSKLTGKATAPKAAGKITVRNGFIFLKNFGENTVEKVQLEGEEKPSFSTYDSLALDMEIILQKDFYIRNRTYLDMEIEMTGDLAAQKSKNEELQLFGELRGIDGYVRPIGKVFDLEEAGFTFSGPIDDPVLFIRSRHIPPTRQKGEAVITVLHHRRYCTKSGI